MISIQNLTATYQKRPVLNEINISIAASEIIAIIGPSGSGKSTLLKSLVGLKDIDSGQILINNNCVVSRGYRDLNTITNNLGLVFQNCNLFPNLNVLENLILAPQLVQKQSLDTAIVNARRLLSLFKMSDKENAFPLELSGGQAQRVAIARAMALSPKALLFDEPTSALDPELTTEVLTTIKTLAQTMNAAMIIVTHELEFAQEVADRIVFLKEGQIIADAKTNIFFEQQKNPEILNYIKRIL